MTTTQSLIEASLEAYTKSLGLTPAIDRDFSNTGTFTAYRDLTPLVAFRFDFQTTYGTFKVRGQGGVRTSYGFGDRTPAQAVEAVKGWIAQAATA
jgi:hypothetical protein